MSAALVAREVDRGVSGLALERLEEECRKQGWKLASVDKLPEDYIKLYHEIKTVFVERNAPDEVVLKFIQGVRGWHDFATAFATQQKNY